MRRIETELTRPGAMVPARLRPSAIRAAAAARLAGAPDSPEDVAARMRHAARRSAAAAAATRPAKRAPTTGPAPSMAPTLPKAPGPGVPKASAQSVSAAEPRTHAALALASAPGTRPQKEAEARPRHLRVVEPGLSPAQRRRRARAALIGSIGAAAFIGLALVYFHVVLAQRQFAIDHLNSQVAQAQREYQSERLQVAQLSSPQHIISEAEGQLGMVQPSKVSYLTPSASTGASTSSATIAALGATGASPVLPASQAPAGDANWPTIKSQLAGQP
jgi:hypothetical protein